MAKTPYRQAFLSPSWRSSRANRCEAGKVRLDPGFAILLLRVHRWSIGQNGMNVCYLREALRERSGHHIGSLGRRQRPERTMGGMTVGLIAAVLAAMIGCVFFIASRYDRSRHLAQKKEAGLIESGLILEADEPGSVGPCSVCDSDQLRATAVCLQGCRLNPEPHRHQYCVNCATPHLTRVDTTKFRTRRRALASQEGEVSLHNEDGK